MHLLLEKPVILSNNCGAAELSLSWGPVISYKANKYQAACQRRFSGSLVECSDDYINGNVCGFMKA